MNPTRHARAASPEAPTARADSPPAAARRALFLPVLLLATLAAKAVVLAQLHAHPLLQPVGGLDSEAYVALARRVAAGDLALGPAPYFVAPLYVYFLGLVFALSGGSLLAAKAVQIALGTAAVALVHATARSFGGTFAARAAALLTAATGAFTFSEVLLLQSALDPFLVALALHLLARALGGTSTRRGARAFGAAGAAWGVFALNRPNALAVAVGLVALLVLTALVRRSRVTALRAGALALGAALAVAPVFVRNLVVTGEPILISSHGGLNFYIGNNAAADGTYRRVPGVTPDIAGQAQDAQRVAEEGAGHKLSAREASAWFYARARDWIAAHPGDALRLFARKLAYVFNAADLTLNFSYAYYSRDERTLLIALAVGPWLLLPLGLAGLVWRAADASAGAFRTWAACVPLYALSVATFFVAGRYRQPLLVPLAICAGLALERAWSAVRAGETRALTALAAALLALGLATQWDFGFDDGRGEERAALVEWLIDHERVDDARRKLDQADGPAAGRARLLARAGRALLQRGDARAAAELFAQAQALDPGRIELQLALGQARVAAGDAAGAIAPLRAAFEARVQAAASAFELARALASVGQSDEARAVLRELGGDAPAGAPSLFALGDLALSLREARLAEPYLRRSLAADVAAPFAAEAHEKLGAALSLQDRPAEALVELEQACHLAPHSAGAQLNRAVALTQLGRLREARAAVEEALRLRPGYPQALGLRAELARD